MPDYGPIWSEFFITDAGLRLRTEVIAEKGQIDFIHAEVGEGKPLSPLQIGGMTSLVNYKEDAFVVRSFINDDNNHAMVIKIDNENFNNEVLVTEVAVYAAKGGSSTKILYGYAYALSGYAPMPDKNSGHRAWNLVFNTKISRTSDVTINYNGQGVFLSFDEFETAISNYYNKTEMDSLLSNKANLTAAVYEPLILLPEWQAQLAVYAVDSLKNISVSIGHLKKTNNTSIPQSISVIGKLPFGFTPEHSFEGTGALMDAGGGVQNIVCRLSIVSDGSIRLIAGPSSANAVMFSGGVVFPAT